MSNFNYISSSYRSFSFNHPNYEDTIGYDWYRNSLSVNSLFADISPELISPVINYLNKSNDNSLLHFDTGILPPGLIHIDNKVVIFERPPTYNNIQVIPAVIDNIDYDNSKNYIYRLPIPWTVYFVSYSVFNGVHYPNQIAMYFMSHSLQGADFSSSRLYLPPLLNFYNNATLCNPMFDSMEEINRYDNSVSGVVNAAYNWIWNSGSNLDLTMNIAECIFQINRRSEFSANPFYPLASPISPFTFYIDYSFISHVFSAWEKISLNDISSIPWPNPCTSERVHSTIQEIGTSRILDYFDHYGIDPDDVRLSHEESEDSGNLYDYNENRYYKYLRSLQSPPLYFDEAVKNFINNSETTFQNHSSIDKVISDVFVSLSSLI